MKTRNQHRIDETLTSFTNLSDEIEGTHVATYIGITNAWAAAQVVGLDSTGEYKVVLEQAIRPESMPPTFAPLAEFDQTDGGKKVVNFPVNRSCLYRFRHVEGVATRVLMAP